MKKTFFLATIVSGILLSNTFAQSKIVVIKATTSTEDATLRVVDAINECRATNATKLVFEKGTYRFLPDLATEKYVFTSNNDEGLKRFVFNLSGIKDLEIDGQGSAFIFEGYVCPFLMDNSKNISIKNFTIDYKRTFHSEGTIVAAYQDSLDIAFSDAFPYKVHNNKLMFTGDQVIGKDNAGEPKRVVYPFWHLLEFDAVKREPAPYASDYLNVQNMVVKELKPGLVRIFFPRLKGTVGNVLVFNATDRLVPAFTVSESQDVSFSNLTIYHAGGMGIIAQRSRNIVLDKVDVVAAPGRMLSLVADATHFVNCSGKITMKNCKFESAMDDATNIHGIYAKIIKLISSTEALVKLIHYQQFGFDFLKPDAKVEITEAESLNEYQQNTVVKSIRLNKEFTKVKFAQPISGKVKVGDVIAASGEYPDVLVDNCTVLKNRARGFLLGSRGKIVVQNSYFHTQCAAIDLEGDGRFWFEQAGVRDLTLRNNVFDNCNYSLMLGVGVIMVGSGIEESKKPDSRYNRNISIENNEFKLANPCILNLYSVDNLIFKNNKLTKTTDYPMSEWWQKQGLKPYQISNSSNINIQE